MTPREIMVWLNKHGIRQQDFATLIGVTPMAVNHWTSGRRSVSLTVVRLMREFDKNPKMMEEFGK